MYMERVSVTDRANVIIDQLRERHGDLIFHQSDCCDGSAPTCLARQGIRLLIGNSAWFTFYGNLKAAYG